VRGNRPYGSSYPVSRHRVTAAVQGQPSGISTASWSRSARPTTGRRCG